MYRGSKKLHRKELFFDNMNDSDQLNNLIEDVEYYFKINRFRDFLNDKMSQLNDTPLGSSWYLKNRIQNRNIRLTATP